MKIRVELDTTELHKVLAETFRCVLHAHGFTIARAGFVPHALPGERIEALYDELGRNAAQAAMSVMEEIEDL